MNHKRFFSETEDGLQWHFTEEEAKEYAQEALLAIEETGLPDGWPEEVTDIEWGELVVFERATAFNVVKKEDDETGACEDGDFDDWCEYKLAAVPRQNEIAVKCDACGEPMGVLIAAAASSLSEVIRALKGAQCKCGYRYDAQSEEKP